MSARTANRADHRHFNDDVLQVDFVRIFWGANAEKAKQQIRFVLGSSRKYQLLLGGRGFGKTWVLALKALWLSLANPGVDGAILERTAKKAIHGKLLACFWGHVEAFRAATGVNLVRSFNRGAGIITMINGARIHLAGYNDDNSLRGLSLGWLVADEVDWGQSAAADIFDALQKLVRERCPMPCLALATSPNGIMGVGGLFMSRIAGADRIEAAKYFVIRGTARDNPALDESYIEDMRRGSSKRSYMQEGEGKVLTASEAIFPEIDLGTHIKVWGTPDNPMKPKLDYIIGVDWGTSAASALFVQICDDGTWVVADEIRMQDTGSYISLRDAISRKVKKIGYLPLLVAADKAVESENKWAKQHFGPTVRVTSLDGGAEQEVAWGLEAIRTMIDPADQDEPRLYFSDKLNYDPHDPHPGIVGSILSYSYMRGANGILTNIPVKSATCPFKHAVDALRYLVVATAKQPRFHGGRMLPFAAAASRLDLSASYRESKEFV